MKMLHGGGNAGGAVLNFNIVIQVVSVTIGSIGLAWIYQIRGRKVMYSGIGANLYYMMYGCVQQNVTAAVENMVVLLETCMAIAFGFLIVDIMARIIMSLLGQEYHIGKNK